MQLLQPALTADKPQILVFLGSCTPQRAVCHKFDMCGTARCVCPGAVSMMECVPTTAESALEEYLPLGLGLGLLVAALVLLLVLRGRQILMELASARINRIKKG